MDQIKFVNILLMEIVTIHVILVKDLKFKTV